MFQVHIVLHLQHEDSQRIEAVLAEAAYFERLAASARPALVEQLRLGDDTQLLMESALFRRLLSPAMASRREWQSWAETHWGISDDALDLNVQNASDNTLELRFTCISGVPLPLFDQWAHSQGFGARVLFYAPAIQRCGLHRPDRPEESQSYQLWKPGVFAQVPQELIGTFGIKDYKIPVGEQTAEQLLVCAYEENPEEDADISELTPEVRCYAH